MATMEPIVVKSAESIFDLDERLVELLERADDAAQVGEIPEELPLEINDYFEAFQKKVDRIAGYWRWQESIAAICSEEAERLSGRKRAADRRLSPLKEMLLAFMMSRGVKRLEGEKAAIGLQANSMASLAIDDPPQVADCIGAHFCAGTIIINGYPMLTPPESRVRLSAQCLTIESLNSVRALFIA